MVQKLNLAQARPDLTVEWHLSKNGELKPTEVSFNSTKSVWWKCEKGSDHEWVTTVEKRVIAKTGCPFCKGKKVAAGVSLAALYPEIAAMWHPSKNWPLAPQTITPQNQKLVWWRCLANTDHPDWQSQTNTVVRGTGCPI